MANELTLIDFCNTPLKPKPISLQSPLSAVDPVGLSSLGCNILLSHRMTAGGNILSTVKNDTGSDTADLLTTQSDSTVALYPNYSAYIVGLGGANPLTGTALSPFPAAACNYQFDYTINGFVAFRDAHPFVNFHFGDNPQGFGSGNQPYPLINLGGQSFDGTFDLLRIPYHNYENQLRIAVAPGGVPMTLALNNGNITWQASGQGTDFSAGVATPVAHNTAMILWECRPALTTFTGVTEAGNLVSATSPNEQPLPGMPRYYGYLDQGPVTMPGYGGTLGGVTYPLNSVRPFVVLYANASLQSVTLNGVPGVGYGLTPFTPSPPGFGGNTAVTQAFSWSLPLDTNPLTFQYTAFNFTLPPVTLTVGTQGVPHFFEGMAISQF